LSTGQSDRQSSNTIVLQFVGDVSLNGLFCDPQYQAKLGESLREVRAGLEPCDLRIGNWESPLWGDGGVNALKQPRLCTTTQAATTMLSFGLHVALLANNHVYDCLRAGYANTIRFFRDNGIRFLGAGRTAAEAAEPLVTTVNGLRLGLLNYVGPETHPSIPDGASVVLNMLDEDRLVSEVGALAARVDSVIVNLHWGMEYVRYPGLEQRRLARRAVDSGATIVAGHHSHCLQGHEAWGRGHIFYSLGNFVFGGLKGRESMPLPALACRVAVATCTVSRGGVERVQMGFLRQEGFALKWDKRPAREKDLERLSRALQLPDRRYARVRKREVFYQYVLLWPFRFLKTSGGLFAALRRLSRHHIAVVWRSVRSKV